MKTRSLLLAPLFALMMIALTGCPEDEPTGPDPATTMLSVTINGTEWVADSVVFQVDALNANRREILAWKGTRGIGESIRIQLSDTAVDDYALTAGTSTVLTYIVDENAGGSFTPDPIQASGGEVKILTSDADAITGTFSFTGTSAFTSTSYNGVDGEFSVRR